MKFEFKKGSLILLSGIPGSGKSTFAQKFFPKHYILSSDELRERYFGDEYKFFEEGLVIKGNFESNSDLIFEILKKFLIARAQEGLTTVVDAMNLNDKVRNSFIQLYPRERVYTIVFDDKKAFEFNEIRKQNQTKGYIEPQILRKKQLTFEKFTKIRKNNIVFADQINEVEEKFEKLELTPNNNILIWGDIHGSPVFYQAYKDLNKKYTKNGHPPLNLFVGDIIDRGPMSIDNLCFVISEIKNNNARMIIGNHEVKLLKNIDTFLQTGTIQEQVPARYKTIKSLVQIHTKNDGIYHGPIKEIVGQKCNLYKVKNFLQSLPFYKIIQTQAGEKFLVTHAPVLIPENLGDLKRSIAIYGAEQLQHNLRLSKSEVLQNNTNFVKAVGYLYKQNPITSIFGHIDLQPLIDQYKIPGAISLEGGVDQGGYIKVLVLSDQDGNITKTIEKIPSKVNYKSYEQKQNIYTQFADNPLINKKDYGDLSIFKYKKKVFYQNLWGKNDHQTNQALLKARGLVLDRQENIVSYPFEKVFNWGEKILNKNNEIITDHTDFKGKYEFVEKINGFLGIISPHPYKPQELLIHTSGSLDGKYVDYIDELLTPDQKKGLLKFFKKFGPHTFMFEVVHPQDPHIIKYSPKQTGLYLIGLRKIQGDHMEDMKLYSEQQLDQIAQELGFERPKHFVDTFDNVLKKLRKQKIEGYMVRDIQDGKHLVKLKSPYYLTTKFLARMNEKSYKFLFNNKDEFIKATEIDEEFVPLVNWIFENQNEFKQLDEVQKAQKITEFLDNQFKDNG